MSEGLFRSLFQGGGLSLVKLLCGLAKVKVLAVVLGVEGVGLLSLGLQFQATAVGLVSMSLAVGVINLGRPHFVAGNHKEAGAILGTALSLVATNAIVFLAGIALFSGSATGWVFAGDASTHGGGIWPLALAAIVVSFTNVLWEGMAFLVDRFDIYVRANLTAAICDVALFSLGAWLYGVTGAFLASVLSASTLFGIYSVLSRRAPSEGVILGKLGVKRRYARPLLSYSALMIGTTAVGLASVFYARAHLAAVSGAAANGYLQVSTALASYMLPFVMTGVWGHLHPSAAASGDSPEGRIELRRTLLACMRLGAAGCVAVVVAAPLLVQVVYTKAFAAAQALIPGYFIGELCYMFLSAFGVYLLAVGYKRAYFIGYALYHLLLVVSVFALVGRLGPWGYVLAHGIGAGTVALVGGMHAWKRSFLDAGTLRAIATCMVAAFLCCILELKGAAFDLMGSTLHVAWLLGPVAILAIMWPYVRHPSGFIGFWKAGL